MFILDNLHDTCIHSFIHSFINSFTYTYSGVLGTIGFNLQVLEWAQGPLSFCSFMIVCTKKRVKVRCLFISRVLCYYYLPVTVVSFATIFISVSITLLPPCTILSSACGLSLPHRLTCQTVSAYDLNVYKKIIIYFGWFLFYSIRFSLWKLFN